MRAAWSTTIVLAAALAALPVRAGSSAGAPAPAPVARYPVAVRVVVPAETLEARFIHDGSQGTNLVNPTTSVAVGAQARDAYAGAVGRVFGAEPVRASLDLVVRLSSSELELDREGWHAAVEHELVLRDPGGAEIARWRVRGTGRIVGFGEKAIPAAFLAAAEYAARTFLAELDSSEAARAWLAGAGVPVAPPGALAVGAPPRLEPTPVPVVTPRSRALVFLDVGGSAVGDGDALSGGFSLRAGWSGRTALVQAAIDLWKRPFTAYPEGAWGSAEGTLYPLSLGVDGGVQRRLGSRLDVQAGLGVAGIVAWASARYTPLSDPLASTTASATTFGAAASVFGALRFNAVLPRTAIRYRLGLEVRQRFATKLDVPEFARELPVADLSVGLFFGIELPSGGARRSEATRGEGGALQ